MSVADRDIKAVQEWGKDWFFVPPTPPPDPPTPHDDLKSQFVLDCLEMESEGDGILYNALFANKVKFSTIGEGVWWIYAGHCWRKDKTNICRGLIRFVAERYGAEIYALEEQIMESKKQISFLH